MFKKFKTEMYKCYTLWWYRMGTDFKHLGNFSKISISGKFLTTEIRQRFHIKFANII